MCCWSESSSSSSPAAGHSAPASLPRLRSQPIQQPSRVVPPSLPMEEQESGSAAGRLAVAFVELIDCLPPRRRATRRRPRRVRSPRRASPRAGRTAGLPHGCSGSGLPTARSGPRRPPGVVSSIGTTTSVRRSVGTPSSRSSRGSGRGPSTWVTVQLTRAVASSDAGPRARMPTAIAAPASWPASTRGTATMSPVSSVERSEIETGARSQQRAPQPFQPAAPERGGHAPERSVRRRPGSSRDRGAATASMCRRRHRTATFAVRAIAARATSTSVRPDPRASSSTAFR